MMTVSGCMKEDSYLNKFFQKFWADIYPEYYYWEENQDAYHDLTAFHQKYYDQFVTWYYASSHPAEDFAESFTAFVLWDDEQLRIIRNGASQNGIGAIPPAPGGWNLINEQGLSYWKWCEKIYRDNSIWEEKIRFFYDFPELVEMRDFIRSNL